MFINTDMDNKIPNLPEHYTNNKPSTFAKQPIPHDQPVPDFTLSIQPFMKDQFAWLNKVFSTHEYDKSVKITWTSYSSLLEKRNQLEVGISSLMPLLRDQAHDIAIKSSLDMIKKAVF